MIGLHAGHPLLPPLPGERAADAIVRKTLQDWSVD